MGIYNQRVDPFLILSSMCDMYSSMFLHNMWRSSIKIGSLSSFQGIFPQLFSKSQGSRNNLLSIGNDLNIILGTRMSV